MATAPWKFKMRSTPELRPLTLWIEILSEYPEAQKHCLREFVGYYSRATATISIYKVRDLQFRS